VGLPSRTSGPDVVKSECARKIVARRVFFAQKRGETRPGSPFFARKLGPYGVFAGSNSRETAPRDPPEHLNFQRFGPI
jgi:hypothetical protein